MFERFGVSPHAEAVYLELVHRIPDSLDGLALTVGLTGEATADVIAELVRHQLLIEDDAAPLGLTVVSPHQGLDILIRREDERLERERASLEASREGLGELLADYVSARMHRSGEMVETIEDSSVVRARLYQLAHQAVSSIWARPPPLIQTRLAHAQQPRLTLAVCSEPVLSRRSSLAVDGVAGDSSVFLRFSSAR